MTGSRRATNLLLATLALVSGIVAILCLLMVTLVPESEGEWRVRWPGVTPYVPVRGILAVSACLAVAALTALVVRRSGRAGEDGDVESAARDGVDGRAGESERPA